MFHPYHSQHNHNISWKLLFLNYEKYRWNQVKQSKSKFTLYLEKKIIKVLTY